MAQKQKVEQKAATVPSWHTVRLLQDARRYGLFKGTMLINEHVSFEEGAILALGVPRWLPMLGNQVLVARVIQFERSRDNERGREIVVCAVPTYVFISQLDVAVQQAALQVARKLPVPQST